MNKKILVVSILAVFTLVAISFATAINTATSVKKKESPLYGIRTRRAIGERLGEIIDYIKTKFLGDRIFFLPFQQIRNIISERIGYFYNANCYDTWTYIPPSWCFTYETCDLACK